MAQPSIPQPLLRPFVNGVRDPSVRLPLLGEVVLIQLTFDSDGPASVISPSAFSGATGRNYHTCVLVSVEARQSDIFVSGYVSRSFSGHPNPVTLVENCNTSDYMRLLPMPGPGNLTTPREFGGALQFNNYRGRAPAWLVVNRFSCPINVVC